MELLLERPDVEPVLLRRGRVVVVFALESSTRAPDSATAYASTGARLALLAPSSLPSCELLPKLAALTALHEQQVHHTAALIREQEEARPLFVRLAPKLRQQRLDPRDVVEAYPKVQVTVTSGLSAKQRIDAPTAVDPVVDSTRVESAQDLEYIRERRLGHDAGWSLGRAAA